MNLIAEANLVVSEEEVENATKTLYPSSKDNGELIGRLSNGLRKVWVFKNRTLEQFNQKIEELESLVINTPKLPKKNLVLIKEVMSLQKQILGINEVLAAEIFHEFHMLPEKIVILEGWEVHYAFPVCSLCGRRHLQGEGVVLLEVKGEDLEKIFQNLKKN